MLEDFDSERKENLCGLIEAEHLYMYSHLTHQAEIEGGIQEDLRELMSAGYGDSLKSVDQFFSNHLKECFMCAEYVKKELRLLRLYWSIRGTPEEMRNLGFSNPHLLPEWRELHRQLPIEHLDAEINPYGVRSYIKRKYCWPSLHTPNKEYDKHIQSCDFCQKFDSLSSQIIIAHKPRKQNP